MCEDEWQKNVRRWRDSLRMGLKFVTAARYRTLLRMRGYRGKILRDPVQYKIRYGRLLWW